MSKVQNLVPEHKSQEANQSETNPTAPKAAVKGASEFKPVGDLSEIPEEQPCHFETYDKGRDMHLCFSGFYDADARCFLVTVSLDGHCIYIPITKVSRYKVIIDEELSK